MSARFAFRGAGRCAGGLGSWGGRRWSRARLLPGLGVILAGVMPAPARDIHVGRDVPTIALAIREARPGDTIHLEPKVYRDYAGFHGKKGEPGRPITLDGHGAVLEGSDPIVPAEWREVSPGLFANGNLPVALNEAVIARWFFLWNGAMNHMGRTSKGFKAPLKKPGDLRPGEWTFVRDPARETPAAGRMAGTFYLRLPPGQPLAAAGIFAPVRSAGVQFSGGNAHLVIRNLTATHPHNDGFNIHGDCRDVVFENIRAIECGDDGISAHETARYRVDGLVSIGNSTGICDTGASRTSYDRVFIADCLAFDLYFLDRGRYRLTNALVLSSAENPLVVTGGADGRCELEVENVLVRRTGPPRDGLIERTAIVRGRRFTLEGMGCDTRGERITEGVADLAEIMRSFGGEMRAAVLPRHASRLPPGAADLEGRTPTQPPAR